MTEAIHGWFNLSYSSHLVLEPDRMERLPAEWHGALVAALTELKRSFPDVDLDPYGTMTLALAAQQWECGDLSTEQMAAIDMSTSDDLDDHSDCEHLDDEDENWGCERDRMHWYDWRGDEHGRDERVMVPVEDEEQARAEQRIVVSRTLLQSMPDAWQERFVALLEQADDVDVESPEGYDIRFYTADGIRTTDPIPHYNRGRTRLVPALGASS